MAFDLTIFNFIHQIQGRYLILDWLGIFLAAYLPYLLVLLFVFIIFWKTSARKKLYFVILSLLSVLISRGLVVSAIRYFYPKNRPFVSLNFKPLIDFLPSASFPSGHATVFFALATLVFFIDRRWFGLFLAGAVVNALARVYVGVHWPSDVLVGAAVGVLTVLLVKKLLPKNQALSTSA